MEKTTLHDEKDNVNAEVRESADTAGAEKEKITAAGLGKFGNVDALIAAYSSLEAEFTRRSQRLKELEEGNKAQNVSATDAPSPSAQGLMDAALGDEGVKTAIIEQYLKGLSGVKSVPLVTGGLSSAAPRTSPKTIKEAGALAQSFLKK